MSCEEVAALIRRIAVGFTMLFLSGFLILYYAIRKLACATSDLCTSASLRPGPTTIHNVDVLVSVFVISVLFVLLVGLGNLNNTGDRRR